MRISSHIHRLLAAAVAIVYLAGVFGFDVHRSEDTHRTYVIPLFAGISCDHIHPESPCHHHGNEECQDHEDCCHDTVEMLDITGSVPDDAVTVPASAAMLPVMPASVPASVIRERTVSGTAFHSPPSPGLSKMCVLRA